MATLLFQTQRNSVRTTSDMERCPNSPPREPQPPRTWQTLSEATGEITSLSEPSPSKELEKARNVFSLLINHSFLSSHNYKQLFILLVSSFKAFFPTHNEKCQAFSRNFQSRESLALRYLRITERGQLASEQTSILGGNLRILPLASQQAACDERMPSSLPPAQACIQFP